MKYGKAIAFTILGAILFFIGHDMLMARARRDGEALTTRVYEELVKGQGGATLPGVAPAAYGQMQAQDAALGSVVSFRVLGCITQITTRPTICSVEVSRERGNSIEKLYWYGDSCLRFETEVLADGWPRNSALSRPLWPWSRQGVLFHLRLLRQPCVLQSGGSRVTGVRRGLIIETSLYRPTWLDLCVVPNKRGR